MDLNLLSLFVDIAEAPSLSAAASRLGVTRSHVSERLRTLERHLGTQLMRRTTRRLELTEAGQTVYEHGIRLRREAESVTAAVGALGRDTVGFVRLSIPTGFGRLVVAPLLLAFQEQHPRISLSVRFSNRVDDLIAAQVDVAIRVASMPQQDMVARELGPVRWCICAAPSYLAGRPPIRAAADIAGASFVCPPMVGRRLILKVGETAVVTVSPRLQSEDFCFLLDAVEAGIGIGILPHYMVTRALAEGRLESLLPGAQVSNAGETLYLLKARTPYPPPAQSAVADYLTRTLSGLT